MKRALIDVDGISADYISAWIDAYSSVTKLPATEQDITSWKVEDCLPRAKDYRLQIQAWTHALGWCRDLQEYPGAVAGIKRVMEVAEVVFVTSPLDSRYWAREREEWLHARFGADCKIVSTKWKSLVKGDLLLDDRVENLLHYQEAWPEAKVICWSRPWNADAPVKRTNDWDEVYRECTRGL